MKHFSKLDCFLKKKKKIVELESMKLEFCSNGTRVLRFFFFWVHVRLHSRELSLNGLELEFQKQSNLL